MVRLLASLITKAMYVLYFLGLRKWGEKDGVVYFWVSSRGTTKEQWIARFRELGVKVCGAAFPEFPPSFGRDFEVVIVRDNGGIRSFERACNMARMAGFARPTLEVACLAYEFLLASHIQMDAVAACSGVALHLATHGIQKPLERHSPMLVACGHDVLYFYDGNVVFVK